MDQVFLCLICILPNQALLNHSTIACSFDVCHGKAWSWSLRSEEKNSIVMEAESSTKSASKRKAFVTLYSTNVLIPLYYEITVNHQWDFSHALRFSSFYSIQYMKTQPYKCPSLSDQRPLFCWQRKAIGKKPCFTMEARNWIYLVHFWEATPKNWTMLQFCTSKLKHGLCSGWL